jgi:hypothetical protein
MIRHGYRTAVPRHARHVVRRPVPLAAPGARIILLASAGRARLRALAHLRGAPPPPPLLEQRTASTRRFADFVEPSSARSRRPTTSRSSKAKTRRGQGARGQSPHRAARAGDAADPGQPPGRKRTPPPARPRGGHRVLHCASASCPRCSRNSPKPTPMAATPGPRSPWQPLASPPHPEPARYAHAALVQQPWETPVRRHGRDRSSTRTPTSSSSAVAGSHGYCRKRSPSCPWISAAIGC